MQKFRSFEPRLFVEEENESVISLSDKSKLSLYKKSQKSGIGINVLEEVYIRGYNIWNESFGSTPEQFGFDRVNSFISGGFACQIDNDLMEKQEPLQVNLSARDIVKDHLEPNGWKMKKNKEIHDIYTHHASREHIAVPRHKGDLAPGIVRQIIKTVNSHRLHNEESNKPSDRLVGTNSLTQIYMKDTPYQIDTKKIVTTLKKIGKEKRQ